MPYDTRLVLDLDLDPPDVPLPEDPEPPYWPPDDGIKDYYLYHLETIDNTVTEVKGLVHDGVAIVTLLMCLAFAFVFGKWLLSSFFGW